MPGKVLVHEGVKARPIERAVFLHTDDSFDNLATDGIGFANDRNVINARALSQYSFDVGWVDVETGGNNEVLFAVNDCDVMSMNLDDN